MDKLKMRTPNLADENFKKLSTLFPNAVTETIDENGEVVRAIDKDVLMQEISCKVVDGKEERYQFTWPDKKKAVLLANSPINMTLRPCREESVDFDNTENLYIEGDNLDVLKLLRETYLGKVKMIYIDPPYNTGKDFVYNDNFAESADDYLDRSGQFDEDGNRLVQNTESNGRFHTDWLNMFYPRLKIARDLLKEDGVIFISIDDNEQDNTKKLCDEIFGNNNFVTKFTRKGSGGRQDSKYYAIVHEYIFCYAKNIDCFTSGKIIKEDDSYPFFDEQLKKHYKTQLLRKWGENSKRSDRPNLFYPITDPDGNENFPMVSDTEEGRWRWGKETMTENIKKGLVEFKKRDGKWIAYEKLLEPDEGEYKTKLYSTVIDDISNNTGASLIKSLFNGKAFDYPKPVDLITRVLKLGNVGADDIVLDFFSGSATTAHAVMQLNAEDGGHRKFIMVQLPEKTDEKSEAYKSGYKNICEIGKERIRRAGAKIKEQIRQIGITYRYAIDSLKQCNFEDEPDLKVSIVEASKLNQHNNSDYYVTIPKNDDIENQNENQNMANALDVGFRVLKLDSSNMKDVYYKPDEFQPNLLDSLADNIKEDRTAEDLLFQVMLDLGILLSSKIEETTIDGKNVFNVEDNYLIACFDEYVTEKTITAIAKQKPLYFVMRDSSMANDSVATNFEQIFATYSADTIRKVL